MIAHLRLRVIVPFIFSLFSALAAVGSPAISKISPTVGAVSPVGSAITIAGTGFGATQDVSSVTVGGIASAPSSWSDTKIIVPVPGSLMPGFADVIVTVGGSASNAQSFLVIPIITAVSPAHAPVGGSVTLTGTSFGDAQGASTVTFNGLPATPSAWANTSITFPIPAGATSGTILVTVNGWATNGVYYYVAPSINGLSPASGPIGSSLTINGSGFGAVQNYNPVTLGDVSITPSFWSDTAITVPVPANLPAGGASVVVTVNTMHSNAASFTISPAITGISVASGAVGDSIAITGTSFGASQGANVITFNGLLATPSSWSDTSIIVPVPSGATTGPLIITINGVASNGVIFTVLQAMPTITSISPNPVGGCGNTTITGSGFGSTAGAANLAGNWLNSASGWLVSWTDSAIVLLTPDFLGQGSFPIYVSTSDGHTSNTVQLAINPALYVSPGQLNLLVGSSQNLQVLDATGAMQTNVQWSVADTSVARITLPVNAGGPTVLQANAEGATTITASAGGLTAQATVTVWTGTSLPSGASPWAAPPLSCAGGGIQNIIQSVRVDDDTPDFYAWDSSGASSIRAFDAKGQQKWVWPAPGAAPTFPRPLAADQAGGVLTQSFETAGQHLTRIDEKGNQTWSRPTGAGALVLWGEYAVASDGTVYLVEDSLAVPPQAQPSQLVAVDGKTGQTKFTITLPMAQWGTINASGLLCTPGLNSLFGNSNNTPDQIPAMHGLLSISSDGVVYLPVLVETRVLDGLPCDPGPNVPQIYLGVDTSKSTLTYSADLDLMEIQPDGTYSIVTLDSTSYNGPNWSTPVRQFDGFNRAIPDGHGSALYASQNSIGPIYPIEDSRTWPHEALIYRDTGGSFPNPTGGGGTTGDPILIGENNIGFAANFVNNGTVAAFDLTTGLPKYIFQSTQDLVRLNMVASDGSLFIEEGNFGGTNYLTKLDPTGNPSPVFPGNPNIFSPTYVTLGHWAALGLGNLAIPQGNLALAAASDHPRTGGNEQNQNQPPTTPIVIDYLPSYIESGADPNEITTDGFPCFIDQKVYNTNSASGCNPKSGRPVVTQQYKLHANATVQNFMADLTDIKPPASAIAFIGHDMPGLGVTDPSKEHPTYSIGLSFYYPTGGPWDKQDPPYLVPLPQPGNSLEVFLPRECFPHAPTPDQCPSNQYPLVNKVISLEKKYSTLTDTTKEAYPYQNNPWATEHPNPLLQDKLAQQAKILFFATCNISPVFYELWDLDPNKSAGRAIILPPSGVEVPLGQAAQEWQFILQELLVNHRNVADAIDEANCRFVKANGTSVTQWTPKGDKSVRLVSGKEPKFQCLPNP